MTVFDDIRPKTTPTPLSRLLQRIGDWDLRLPAGVDADTLLIEGISIESADIDKNWIFVGVPGQKRHGARYAKAAKNAGATVLITDQQGAGITSDLDMPTVTVEDPRLVAGLVSHNIYDASHEDLFKVGVTGTNGKTTTTYFIRAALAPMYAPGAIFGTIEIEAGGVQLYSTRTTHESPVVHRTLALAAQQGDKCAVVEISAHALSLDRVAGLRFDIGVFMNLQHDHLDYYHTMDKYFEAKALLFSPTLCKQGVICVDDEYGRRLARSVQVPITCVQVLSDDEVDVAGHPLWKVSQIEPDPEMGGSRFMLKDPEGQRYGAFCPLPGLANVQDAGVALVTARSAGVAMEDAIEALRNAPPVPGRMHWITSAEDHLPRVMVDYAHTPEAVELLTDALHPITKGNLVAVFGTDGDRDATKREPLGAVFAAKADILWVTDENPRSEPSERMRTQLLAGIRSVRPDMHNVIEVTTSRRDAIREAILAAAPDDVVVITGKGAERVQEISGIFHHFYDPDVAAEVLRDAPKR